MERASGTIHYPGHGAPENELPVAVTAPAAVWRGDGAVFAIPSLHVYTPGAELHIMYRTAGERPGTAEQARKDAQALRYLSAAGQPVTLLRGSHAGHGFTYQAWISFTGPAPEDLAVTLDWPGFDDRPRLVPGIRDAAQRVTTLW